MRDVGDSGDSRATRVTKRAIERKGRVILSSGLQGRNATVRDFERIAGDVFEPGGYRRASSKYPWDTTTKSDVGRI